MLARLFQRLIPQQSPRSTREMIRVLRAAAQFADDPTEQAEYSQAADALDRVITASERYSDAPTRDAFAYALGRAELDLGDKLAELIEIGKEDHMLLQDVQQAQTEHGAAAGSLRDELTSFVGTFTTWRTELETWRSQVDTRLETFMARLGDERDQVQAQAHKAMCGRIAELNDRLRDASERMRDIEDQLIAEGPREDRAV